MQDRSTGVWIIAKGDTVYAKLPWGVPGGARVVLGGVTAADVKRVIHGERSDVLQAAFAKEVWARLLRPLQEKVSGLIRQEIAERKQGKIGVVVSGETPFTVVLSVPSLEGPPHFWPVPPFAMRGRSLGAVRIEVTVKDGMLITSFVPSDPNVKKRTLQEPLTALFAFGMLRQNVLQRTLSLAGRMMASPAWVPPWADY